MPHRSKDQVLAGCDFLPVVDSKGRPITLGCRVRAIVRTYRDGVKSTVEVVATVVDGYFRHCAMRFDGFAINILYHDGMMVCEDCEVI